VNPLVGETNDGGLNDIRGFHVTRDHVIEAIRSAKRGPVAEGTVGAGTGATVAKRGGAATRLKGGIGTAARELAGGVLVGALVAVNALGGVYDPWTGLGIAVPRAGSGDIGLLVGEHTTIGVIATNARLDSAAANRLATLGHDGLAMAIRPAHTVYDGDSLFAVSLPSADAPAADLLQLGEAAAAVVADAIVRGIRAARSLHGVSAAGSAT
jgi:L-aminopeptidase/D-esterase-like protein